MSEKKGCRCCSVLGAIVLVLGALFGIIGDGGFGLPHALAMIVGVIMVIVGLKKPGLCKCCNKQKG